MSHYAADTNISNYRESQPIYVTNVTAQKKLNVGLKLNLNESNFNFNTIREDGLDFRLCASQNGTGTLNMWIAYWDYDRRRATVWFKLPELVASQTKTLWAYWGYASDTGISDLDSITGADGIFLFSDGFDDASLNPLKWESYGSYSLANSKINLGTDSYLEVVSDSLELVESNYTSGEEQISILEGIASWYTTNNWSSTGLTIFNDGDLNNGTRLVTAGGYHAVGFGIYPNNNINRIRVYAKSEDGGTVVDWDSGSIALRFSEGLTSSINDYDVSITYNSMPDITSKSGSHFTFDFVFDPPGKIVNGYVWINVISNPMVSISPSGSERIIITEFKIYRKDAETDILVPGWKVEEGIEGIGSPTTTTVYAHRYMFLGGENEFEIRYYWDGNTDRYHNFELGGTVVIDNGTNRGLEIGSYSQNYVGYYEDTDYIYQGMSNRENYEDYDDTWERKVHRNTEIQKFRIYGEDSSTANGVGIDWVIVRGFDPDAEPEINITNLLIPYENIIHQPLDFTSYTTDITSVDFYHSSDIGGNPYLLSNNIVNSVSSIWSSDTTTSGSLIIDFGRGSKTVNSKNYTHYDNSHVEFYAAMKLSDNDGDIYSANYWQCTTNSDVWAAIKYPVAKSIGCISVKAVASKLNGMVKDYKVYGSDSDPRLSLESEWTLLAEGTFSKTTVEQTIYLSIGRFYYYILKAENSYGDNIALQEWAHYEAKPSLGKRSVSQLRLYPVVLAAQEDYFPKHIEFYGSNNGVDWTQLIENKETYTPFYDSTYGRWQRYSFLNNSSYYMYKLVVIDNWYAINDIIKIAEWEMVELVSETNNHRILFGTTNDIEQIWADPTATFDSGNIYALNDVLNTIYSNTAATYTTISGEVADINVII